MTMFADEIALMLLHYKFSLLYHRSQHNEFTNTKGFQYQGGGGYNTVEHKPASQGRIDNIACGQSGIKILI